MRRIPAPGVRGRLVLALLAVSVVTLAVTALLVLPPLEQRLRDDTLRNLAASTRSAAERLEEVPASVVRLRSPELVAFARSVRRRTGAQVAVVDAGGRVLAATDVDAGEAVAGLKPAPRGPKSTRRVIGSGNEAEAQTAQTAVASGHPLLVALTRPLNEAQAAAAVFRRGFVRAAAISLLVALALGGFLATRLVRRLRALSAAAGAVARIGPAAEVASDPARDEVGDLTRTLATMQHRLQEQEQARRTFVATASHELRTPLAALRLQLGLLREELDAGPVDPADAREQVIHAEAQAVRLSGLAADLLDLSRLDAGVPPRREPTALGEVCRSTATEFDGSRRQGGAQVEVTVERELPAWGDRGAVARVVRILIDNALRHSPSDGIVRVRVGPGAAVAVEDEGPGIAPADREQIFDRFQRGSETGDRAGFGLGLAIGRELAHRMEGDLVLDRPAAPTSFVLRLQPVEAAEADQIEP